MLLEFEIAKEDAILELLEEGELVQMDLSSEEPVLKRRSDGTVRVLTSRPCTRPSPRTIRSGVEKVTIFRHVIAHRLHLLHLVRSCEEVIARWIQVSNGRKQAGPLFFAQVCAEGIDGYVDGAPVSFECEDSVHVLVGWSSDCGRDEVVKVFEVRFVEGVSDDFDV
jgi:hypothetical protein